MSGTYLLINNFVYSNYCLSLVLTKSRELCQSIPLLTIRAFNALSVFRFAASRSLPAKAPLLKKPRTMKTIQPLYWNLDNCLDIIIWTDLINGDWVASADFVKLLSENYCLN